MSSFSASQRDLIASEFWARSKACCPHDGSELHARFFPDAQGYLLVLACARCSRKAQWTRYSDPRRDFFRRWTQAERNALLEAHRSTGEAGCPVCGAKTLQKQHGDPTATHIACLRCGNAELFIPAEAAESCAA